MKKNKSKLNKKNYNLRYIKYIYIAEFIRNKVENWVKL